MNEKARARWLSVGRGVAAGALVAVVVVVLAWYLSGGFNPPKRSGPDYEGSKLEGPAPDFRLVDQNGASVSLSDFRGRVAVLTLLDPDCTDICPIYAYHYRLAYQALGQDAAKVAFLAFNANDEKTSVADVRGASKKWSMEEIPAWHFLTGSAEELKAVWKAYGVLGSGPPKRDKPNEKQHSPAFFVIDQAGQRRWFFSTNFEDAPPPSALIVKHVKALLAEAKGE